MYVLTPRYFYLNLSYASSASSLHSRELCRAELHLTQDALRTISRARQFDCLSQSTLTIALSHHGTKRIYCCVYGSLNAVVHHGTQGTPRVDRLHGDAFDVMQAFHMLAALKVSLYDGRNAMCGKKTGCPNIHFRAQRGRRTPFHSS